MKLLENEAKHLLTSFNIPVPKGSIVNSENIEKLPLPAVLKSQVPVGGRGKAGGIVVVSSLEELRMQVKALLQLPIKGFLPKVLLAEEYIPIKNELYLSFLIDRASSSIRLIAHKNGGIEVEDNDSETFFNEEITKQSASRVAKDAATFLGYDTNELASLTESLFEVFIACDATLLEINPLIVTEQGIFICGDCKIELDDAAAFRHPDWNFEDTTKDSNFAVLNELGNVATIANGAGLAMATVDAVKAYGMMPANFLDIGGGATTESVRAAFIKIQEFPNIQAIVINIFAGITRCDQIAKAVIEARRRQRNLPPLFIRLAGTNFEEAVALLATEDIPTLGTLEDCLEAAKEIIHE